MKEFFQKSRLKISSFLGCVLYIGTAGFFFSTGVHIIQMIVIYETSHIENVDYNRIWQDTRKLNELTTYISILKSTKIKTRGAWNILLTE